MSETAANRDFNVMLIMKAPSAAMNDPDEKAYREVEAAMKAMLDEDKQKNLVKGYEQMRSFFGEQSFRKISFK